MAYKFANNFFAYIQHDIDANDTEVFIDRVPPVALQVSIGDGDVWTAKIGYEIIKITDYDNTGDAPLLTIERAQEDTAAEAHDAGAALVNVVTVAGLDGYISEQIDTVNEASEITYDNQTSGLTATDVQAAVDEIDDTIDNLDASQVSYDPTGTVYVNHGPTITTVEEALNEHIPTYFWCNAWPEGFLYAPDVSHIQVGDEVTATIITPINDTTYAGTVATTGWDSSFGAWITFTENSIAKPTDWDTYYNGSDGIPVTIEVSKAADNITLDVPITSWGQDGVVVTGTGVHKFSVPYNMTITRIEATLDINGPSALTITLKDMYVDTGAWTLRNDITTAGQTIIASNNLKGSITNFADATVPAGDVLRLDIIAADALAESPVITVWAKRT